jgi:AraC family transcriptional regulator, carnitine catabolism transcriptional activator
MASALTESSSPGVLLPGPIAFLLIPQFAVMALASAIEPLRIANRYLKTPYTWKLLSLDGRPVADDNGILIQPHGSIHDDEAFGTVILCADIQPDRFYSRPLRTWLHRLNAAGTSLGALDTGCFLLARAGLLQGCKVTMHWEVVAAFQERFPSIVTTQTLYEVSGKRLTCAGGTAALDMMLSAISSDHGRDLANRVAEHCLHDHPRAGDVAQRMATSTRSRVHHPALALAMNLLETTLDRPVAVAEIATRAKLSVRQLLRLFATVMGEGPAQFHRRLRLEHARGLLRNTSLSVTEAAVASGFESLAHFCRAYRGQYGQTPGSDRRGESPQVPRLRDAVARVG